MRESRRPRPSTRAAIADVPPIQTDAATRSVWLGLLVLTGVRAAAAFVPGMWVWGDVHRFLSPVGAWLPWALAAAALIPAVGRMLAPPCEWLGRAIVRGGPARAAFAVLAGVLAWSLPDRVHYVGDFLMREGTVEAGVDPSGIWPQAQPLDVLLHDTLPRALELRHVGDALQMSRVTGAIEAALLAWLAIAFARAIAARGAVALAVACTVFFGGTLGLFTGYGKAFSELIVLVAAAGVLAVRIAQGNGGIIWLGVVTALAVALHRSALGFLPLFGYAWWLARGAAGETQGWRRFEPWCAVIVVAVALGAMAPKLVHTVLHVDPVHFAASEGGPWATAFAGTRALDMLNLALALSPLGLLVPALATSLRGPTLRSRELIALVLLALPFVIMVPLIHPVNGMFRDWDDFAPAAEALTLVAAWLIARALAAPTAAPLAVAVTLAVAAPSVQWLRHHHDVERGMARIAAALREPPARSAAERGRGWDFLGTRNVQLGRYGEAADDFRRAADTSPSPRMLQQWAMAATFAGRLTEAQDAYRRQLEKEPGSVSGWYGLADVSMRLGDEVEARRAVDALLRLSPGHPVGLRMRAALDGAAERRAADAASRQ